ncbi:MAG: hypothetical protein K9M07_05795 [Simkaniaceae bacterium]|nr:hypothetical protein [Simkaniaceae bacterium]MCF7852733.1 hypothetical protein [Simkaniaceae bacterium]
MSKILNKIFGIGIIALFALAPGRTQASDIEAVQVVKKSYTQWTKMHSTSGKCHIFFPDEPEHMQQTMMLPEDNSELKYEVYVAGLDQKAVYMVLIAEYPTMVDQSYSQLSLESFLNGILTQNPHNRLIFADLVNVQGHKGLDFFIRTKDVYFMGRAIMANNQLYLLAMECEMQNYQEDDFKHFINSFEFIK